MEKHQILKQYFGYDGFREGQELLIDSMLAGRDTLGIMPTGAGKSLCFQIPALMFPGITLVISPLISLMKDQVAALKQAGVPAAYLNSSLTGAQYFKALENAKCGRYPIIYVAPERLTTEAFLDFALHAEISMIAIDEAHCVSQWGQDFRPSYLRILDFIEMLPQRPVISGFTATATGEVRDDVINILQLREPTVLTTGFDRPNLYFAVQTPKDKYGAVRSYLEAHPKESGIIYCLTRKTVEEVCSRLQKDGFGVTRYHAGLSDRERQQNQEDFIYDVCPLIVATNAFGMGIDKSNVRFVLHYNMPKNMESYYQEAGRAGRDGEPSECILYYSGQDVVTNQFFIDNNQDNEELDDLARQIVMERDRDRLKKMTYYCFTNECLRAYILQYFGEEGAQDCGSCGNCLGQFDTEDVSAEARIIIGCAASSRQRYGINLILDTVRGAATARIRQTQMDENPYYGKLSGLSAHRLRQVLNHLLLTGGLRLSDDEYAVVRLTGKSMDLVDGEEPVLMKLSKDEGRGAGEKKKPKSRAAGAVLSEADQGLFEELRQLRAEIAKKEKVPPYMVFSDKTLVQMSAERPGTRAEILEISGVGEFKYEKYGKQFLEGLQKALERQQNN